VRDVAVELTLVEAGDWHPAAAKPPVAQREGLEEALYSTSWCVRLKSGWLFLHPIRLVWLGGRSTDHRIRGAAGTSKTVVGLHRAVTTSPEPAAPFLVTTLVKTLPAVLSSLHGRMAPEMVDRIEFSGIEAWCARIPRSRTSDLQGPPRLARHPARTLGHRSAPTVGRG
jgi:hypothetical protein